MQPEVLLLAKKQQQKQTNPFPQHPVAVVRRVPLDPNKAKVLEGCKWPQTPAGVTSGVKLCSELV